MKISKKNIEKVAEIIKIHSTFGGNDLFNKGAKATAEEIAWALASLMNLNEKDTQAFLSKAGIENIGV